MIQGLKQPHLRLGKQAHIKGKVRCFAKRVSKEDLDDQMPEIKYEPKIITQMDAEELKDPRPCPDQDMYELIQEQYNRVEYEPEKYRYTDAEMAYYRQVAKEKGKPVQSVLPKAPGEPALGPVATMGIAPVAFMCVVGWVALFRATITWLLF